jgi:PAS domain S-box-containing protein
MTKIDPQPARANNPARVDEIMQHLSAIVEYSHDAILSKDLDGVITSWNEGAKRLFGYAAEEVIGQSVTILIPDDRQDEERAILERLRAGEATNHFETIRLRKDGGAVHVSLTVSPIRDAAGAIVGASKIVRDISDRLRLAEQQSLLLDEMQHRVKNLTAVIEALAWQSRPAGEPAVDAFLTVFLGRLRALLSTGELVISSSKRDADLERVFELVLAPFVDPAKPSPISLVGPSVSVPERTAGALALAAHELATNALKYGALKSPEGRVSIAWTAEPNVDQSRICVVWKETGGPEIPGPPERRGFGSRVIRAVAAQEREGKTEIAFERDGLRCTFEFLTDAARRSRDDR